MQNPTTGSPKRSSLLTAVNVSGLERRRRSLEQRIAWAEARRDEFDRRARELTAELRDVLELVRAATREGQP